MAFLSRPMFCGFCSNIICATRIIKRTNWTDPGTENEKKIIFVKKKRPLKMEILQYVYGKWKMQWFLFSKKDASRNGRTNAGDSRKYGHGKCATPKWPISVLKISICCAFRSSIYCRRVCARSTAASCFSACIRRTTIHFRCGSISATDDGTALLREKSGGKIRGKLHQKRKKISK